MKKARNAGVAEATLVNKIYFIRGQKVMIDRDLAELYGVETKRLKEAVRRNLSRFPGDFMFQMNTKELKNWRSQIASSNSEDKMGLRHSPFCFTEQGVTMLSCILNSKRAVQVNVRVIRIFAKFRETLLSNKEILSRLELLEKNVESTSEEVSKIFGILRQLLSEPRHNVNRSPMSPDRVRIGYRSKLKKLI